MPLDPLATLDDLETRAGRDLTDAEVGRAAALLADASSSVRGYTGQEITEGTSTAHLRIRHGFVTLPQRPVTAVDGVTDANDNDVSFTWTQGDRVAVRTQVVDSWSFEPYRTCLASVDVTYDHGYAEVPADIVGVVCGIVLRSLGQAATETGVVEESIDNYRYRLGSAAAAGGFGLLPEERRVLDRYRRQGGTIALRAGL